MTSAVATRGEFDVTNLPWVLRCGIFLGAIEAVAVLLFSLSARFLPAPIDFVVCLVILVAGAMAVIALPGVWTRALTVEGIAGAAGVGLLATVVFLLIDVSLLQPIGTYTNRWLEIGGGANWWYHPVWWMLGTYAPWMGAFIMANQAAKGGRAAPVTMLGTVFVIAILLMALATVFHVFHASWNLGTLAVALFPALGLGLALSSIGVPRA